MTTERYELVEGYMEFAPEDGKWVHWSDYSKMRSAHLAEVHSLKSRIAELEKDAARLNWMINEQAFMEYERDNYWLVFTDGSEQKQSHNSARQAIDDAMQKD